ncbi:hypothetical protein OB920_20620 [Halobacteria archaeon HArc-gm2]|nr:hypothetical protein [Halobacteria archaeon HArc-gm2]
MATIQSFTESLGVLKRNPLLFAAGALYAAILLPQTALSTFGIPFVPTLLQMVTFFITPFVIAGLLAMAYEGRRQQTSLATFKKVGKDRYVRLLVGNLIRFVLDLAFIVVFLVVVVFTVGFGMAAAMNGGGDPSNAIMGSVGVVAVAGIAVVGLLYLLVSFFIQFYPVAYVVDDVDVIDGFSRSVGLVRSNFVPALGFSLIKLVVGALLWVPSIALVVVAILLGDGTTGAEMGATATQTGGPAETEMLVLIGFVAYAFLVNVVMIPFRSAFSVAFYENHR